MDVMILKCLEGHCENNQSYIAGANMKCSSWKRWLELGPYGWKDVGLLKMDGMAKRHLEHERKLGIEDSSA